MKRRYYALHHTAENTSYVIFNDEGEDEFYVFIPVEKFDDAKTIAKAMNNA